MALRRATPADLPRIAALFAQANDTPYDLASVAEEKCFGGGFDGEPYTEIADDFAGVSVTCGRYLRILAVDRDQRGRGIGTALLASAEARGARIAAAEPGNYFTPGVIDGGFLHNRGWSELASTQNLITVDLPSTIYEQRATAARRDEILTFIEREFGRIWRFEASRAFENDPPTLFIREENGAITGFAAHDANNRGLGFFGPTGIAKSHRGRGLGKRLLLASLADLRRLGHDHAIVPWTDALDFYLKSCGATIHARFVTMGRVVDSAP